MDNKDNINVEVKESSLNHAAKKKSNKSANKKKSVKVVENKPTALFHDVIKIKKLVPEAQIPSYAHDGDLGMDMIATSVEYNEEKDWYLYHTGIATETRKFTGELLFTRSSNRKTDAYLCNHVGLVDSPIYRGDHMFTYKLRKSLVAIALEECLESKHPYLKLLTLPAVYKKVKENAKALKYAPYKVGDAVGQMVVVNVPSVEFVEVDELSDSVRGDGGHGSTGNDGKKKNK